MGRLCKGPGRLGITAMLAGLAMSVSGPARATESDVAAGEAQFVKSCGTCHTAEAGANHRQGPNLHGVFGRAAGTVEGFKYSDTLKAGGWVWTEETLDPWIENAQKAHPGTVMAYRQRDAAKRALIITYLKTLTQP